MIKYIHLIIFIFSINSLAFCQENQFEWDATTFEIGQKREIRLDFDFDGPCTVRPCVEYENNGEVLEELISFLQKNPKLHIEIASHQDQRGTEAFNQKVSEVQAKGTKETLLFYGIEKERITYSGYGESLPFIPLSEINNLKDVAAKEEAYQTNSRIESKL